MTGIRSFIRFGLFLGASIAIWFASSSLLWAPFLLLAVFFFAVDVLGISKARHKALDIEVERSGQGFGELGHYLVDSTESLGLFFKLSGWTVFIDLREDDLVEKRKQRALFLYQNRVALEESLSDFIARNIDYRERRPTYIGIHGQSLERCDVFWEPDGHTTLNGLQFERD